MCCINTQHPPYPVMAFFILPPSPQACLSTEEMKRSNIFFFYALLLFILEHPFAIHLSMPSKDGEKRGKTFLSAWRFLVILFSFLRSVKLFPFLISIYTSIFSSFHTQGLNWKFSALGCCPYSNVYLYHTWVVRCHNGQYLPPSLTHTQFPT